MANNKQAATGKIKITLLHTEHSVWPRMIATTSSPDTSNPQITSIAQILLKGFSRRTKKEWELFQNSVVTSLADNATIFVRC